MVSLERQLAGQFDAGVRTRGDELVDCVAFVAGWSGDFPCDATVRDGSEEHETCVDPDEVAAGWCSCSEFAVGGPCAHMWATLRAAELAAARPELIESLAHAGDADGSAAEDAPEATASNPSRFQDLIQLVRRGPVEEVSPLDAATQAIHFLLPPEASNADAERACVVHPVTRRRQADGTWGAPEPPPARDREANARPTRTDAHRRLGWLDRFVGNPFEDFPAARLPMREAARFAVDTAREGLLFAVPHRGLRTLDARDLRPIALDEETRLSVRLATGEVDRERVALRAQLVDARGEEITYETVHAVFATHVVVDDRLLPWTSTATADVVADLLRRGPMIAGAEHAAELRELAELARVHPCPESSIPPRPSLRLDTTALGLDDEAADASHVQDGPVSDTLLPDTLAPDNVVPAALEFVYEDADGSGTGRVRADSSAAFVEVGSRGRRQARDPAGERAAIDTLLTRGGGALLGDARAASGGCGGGGGGGGGTSLGLAARNIADRVRSLLEAGFEVSAGSDPIRLAPAPTIRVASGIDWFELEATVPNRDGEEVVVPELLAPRTENARAGTSRLVRIGNGDIVVVDAAAPDLRALRALGKLNAAGALEVDRSRAFVLDGVLRERQGEAELDATFRAIREQAVRGLRPEPRDPRPGFDATLRPYQREALGWFAFLRTLGVGGCLADDMGLGKTVQVLALLHDQSAERPGPSLVVGPRSLLFHWEREAHRFAPALRTLVFAGAGRAERHADAVAAAFGDVDIVMTTYGTLRNDVEFMSEVQWHYLVLDEAHAIKNENSQASRAVRACRARHRLALSGTPVENHLGELWSLFEFLNPGMLGASRAFRRLVRDGAARASMLATADDAADGQEVEATRNFTDHLRASVRPFLLRRTKEQVLDELPPKTVQVLDCELAPAQRRAYDELAAHYRARLLGKIPEGAIPDTLRFQVLEALLRLRQAACHSALVDATRAEEECGKFDVLWPMLTDLRAEGHKALLFSQFPSFLALLRARLDERGVEHAYLDGSTQDRRGQVDRFENDPDCGLFLISIKAGGHGLNLTAASYVFLLDPWWNPAVEAQAIDRAHRMGQKRSVHAYRLICRDTVEERVAELQDRKRRIAEAVLGDDRSVVQDLQAADVAMLLG